MNKEWINKTCQDCVFRVNECCRYGPPVAINLNGSYNIMNITESGQCKSLYPMVIEGDGKHFANACSQWTNE